MLKKHFILVPAFVLAIALTAACGQGQKETASTRPFPSVRIPEIIAADRQEAFSYSTEHFWDELADTSRLWLCDSVHVGGVEALEVERQFAAYAVALHQNSLSQARTSVRRMCQVASRCKAAVPSSNVLDTLTSLMDKYIYDPNSPYRDEDIYGAYASQLALFEGFSPEKRGLYARQAELCALNARETQAADFEFRDARGVTRTLYGIKADYTLLFFSNPGCHACKEIITTLSEEMNVDPMIASGKLAVLNIYIDEDLKAWRDYMPIYPKNWYNGYDPNYVIRGETLYNVRAIPSLYLLSEDKTVLMKDAPNEAVFEALAYIANEN